MAPSGTVTPQSIAQCEKLIRPHIRRTPVVEVEGEDSDFDKSLTLKLELLQHSGAFKARGAFTNLLTRESPKRASSQHRAAITARPSPMLR